MNKEFELGDENLRECEGCGEYTTGRLCISCARQEMIDNDPNPPSYDDDDLENSPDWEEHDDHFFEEDDDYAPGDGEGFDGYNSNFHTDDDDDDDYGDDDDDDDYGDDDDDDYDYGDRPEHYDPPNMRTRLRWWLTRLKWKFRSNDYQIPF